jgi:hypothetical protein
VLGDVAEGCGVAVCGAGLEPVFPAEDEALEVEWREFVWRDVARERGERDGRLPVFVGVVECVRLGPGLADLAD